MYSWPASMSDKHLVAVEKNSTQEEEDEANIHHHLANDDQECRTPTAEENKIPRAQSCPPAPRKRKQEEYQVILLPKRKFPKLESFEIVGHEEVESFFGSSRVSSTTIKKRSSRSY